MRYARKHVTTLCPPSPYSTGLFDGVVTLAALLLSYGASSDAGSAALQGGLGAACLSLMAGGGRAGGPGAGPAGGLLELSPRGVLALLEAVHHTTLPDAEVRTIITARRCT